MKYLVLFFVIAAAVFGGIQMADAHSGSPSAPESSVFPGGYWGPILSCRGFFPPEGSAPCGICDVAHTLRHMANFFFTLIFFAIMPASIMWGGFNIMTSGGSSEKVDTGRKFIKNALIGVVIALLAYGLVDKFFTVVIGTGSNRAWYQINCTELEKIFSPPPEL